MVLGRLSRLVAVWLERLESDGRCNEGHHHLDEVIHPGAIASAVTFHVSEIHHGCTSPVA